MNASKIPAVEEHAIGTEDRVFTDTDGRWWWQCRGTCEAVGPFESRAQAEAAYESCGDER